MAATLPLISEQSKPGGRQKLIEVGRAYAAYAAQARLLAICRSARSLFSRLSSNNCCLCAARHAVAAAWATCSHVNALTLPGHLRAWKAQRNERTDETSANLQDQPVYVLDGLISCPSNEEDPTRPAEPGEECKKRITVAFAQWRPASRRHVASRRRRDESSDRP